MKYVMLTIMIILGFVWGYFSNQVTETEAIIIVMLGYLTTREIENHLKE